MMLVKGKVLLVSFILIKNQKTRLSHFLIQIFSIRREQFSSSRLFFESFLQNQINSPFHSYYQRDCFHSHSTRHSHSIRRRRNFYFRRFFRDQKMISSISCLQTRKKSIYFKQLSITLRIRKDRVLTIVCILFTKFFIIAI